MNESIAGLHEYWRLTHAGGHEVFVYFAPSQRWETVNHWYPQAHRWEPISKTEWLAGSGRLERT
jgi:hypothetical protein